ncbi:MAG TPA: Gfo/Idh/MocA family oxidoreductase [Phaeodactylibacter sp.]|nr:Gfo/Idh/MocA family oxidoreductase [Phaeodactylibacter sp.]
MKIGLIGTGHLGKIHLKCIRQVKDLHLVGCYDIDEDLCHRIAAEYDICAFSSAQELIDAVEIVDIVSPTTTHYYLAKAALDKGKHVFVEKPLCHTLAEAKELLDLSRTLGLKVQVGHVERFNPAFLSVQGKSLSPMFIEAHRLAMFNPRGTDVSVVLDLMIHDIDLVLSLVPFPVKRISASGVTVVSETPDISNARLEFENGCVANLTASRLSLKQMRKLRLFQKDAYISLDFLDKKAQIIRLYGEEEVATMDDADNLLDLDTAQGKKYIHVAMPDIQNNNAIRMELESFCQSIQNDSRPIVDVEDGYRALEVAQNIIKAMQANELKHTPQ